MRAPAKRKRASDRRAARRARPAPPATLDAITFIESTLVDPETERLFVLTPAERRFLRRAFELTPDGRLRHPELLYSAPKKSGKTGFAAMIVIFVVRALGGPHAEGICVANDFEQAQGRVFAAVARIVEASPLLAADATILTDKVTFRSTGATIIAIASDYAGAAGANPTITVFDELWGYTTEAAHRLWDELVPPPTRKIACRLTVSYAGYEGESVLLAELHKRGVRGEEVGPDLHAQPGMLCYWSHRFSAPWQTPAWREQMRAALRPNAYLRLIENRWVSTESTFVPIEWFDACVDPSARPVAADRGLAVWIGVDASVKRDSTAIVVCTWDREAKRVRLAWHRIFQPSARDPLDFEAAVEATLLDLRRRFRVREVRYDPWQMQAVAQRLGKAGLPMVEFAQTVPNLTEASTNLYEVIKGRNLVAYPDAAMRLAVQRAVAVETSRGWKIAKEKQSHRIDVIVALGMAALGAVQGGIGHAPMVITAAAIARMSMPAGYHPAPRPAPAPAPAAGAPFDGSRLAMMIRTANELKAAAERATAPGDEVGRGRLFRRLMEQHVPSSNGMLRRRR